MLSEGESGQKRGIDKEDISTVVKCSITSPVSTINRHKIWELRGLCLPYNVFLTVLNLLNHWESGAKDERELPVG